MKETLEIPGTFQETFSTDSVFQMIMLAHLMKKENEELMANFDLHQTRPSHVRESYTSQLYRNAQVNQVLKVVFVWSKKGATPKN